MNGAIATAHRLNGQARAARAASAPRAVPPIARPWLRAQAVNVTRHAAALRPFHRHEFGDGAAAPTEGHVQVVNKLVSDLRRNLLTLTRGVGAAARAATEDPTTPALQHLATQRDRAHGWVRAIEKIWDFYFELFGQRQSQYADWLLSCDRIALDCYQYAYLGVGVAKSVPAPPPFCYMRTGFSPATFRRGIPLQRLGRNLNPFPLIQLPYHRLVNPWTLGAVLHEVSHNLQSDLGLSRVVPRAIARKLLRSGISRSVAGVWVRWNRETFADLSGLLLGGPTIVGSLMDILARDPKVMTAYSPGAPHPTPILRAYLSFELLKRMKFEEEARRYEKLWAATYPDPSQGNIPGEVVETFRDVVPLVVDAVCYEKMDALGGKTLAQVLRFEHKEQEMIEEAAQRLAAGNDPGVVPERFLIGAARIALDRKYARPGVIAEHFYTELSRR